MAVNIPKEVLTETPEWKGCSNDATNSIQELVTRSTNTKVLDTNQLQELRQLLCEFQESFSGRPGRTNLMTHEMEITLSEPIRSKAYRVPPRQKEIIEAEIRHMLEIGVIEPAQSDYMSPLILVEAR